MNEKDETRAHIPCDTRKKTLFVQTYILTIKKVENKDET